jgi:diguanylate cyclase (GGDEF)-like protein
VLTRRLSQTVHELREREEELHKLAFHDPLTGLANRALFLDRVEHAINKQQRDSLLLGVLYIDLDGFKPINDNLGHAAGDELLVSIAQRLVSSVRLGDTVARLGGDEFAVLLEDVDTELAATALAARIVDVLGTPAQIHGHEVKVTASVGVTLHESGAEQVGELLRHADIAMYAAKLQGKGRYAVFEPQMRAGLARARAV